MAGGRVRADSSRGVENLVSAQGELSHFVVFTRYMVRRPRGSHIVCPLLSLEVATPEKQVNSLHAVIHRQVRSQKRYIVG